MCHIRQCFAAFDPFNTTQYAKGDSFKVLLDRHVIYATGTASDFELTKCLKVRALPGWCTTIIVIKGTTSAMSGGTVLINMSKWDSILS